MTDRRPDPDRTAAAPHPAPSGAGRPAGAAPRARRKPGLMPTVLLGLVSFAVIFEFLAFQLSSGNDPALGKSALAANDAAPARVARPVVSRRIVKTRVVHLPPRPGPTNPAGPVSSPAVGASTVTAPPPVPPAPVTSTS